MVHVILVDEKDNEVGTMEKIEAHQKGVLHRAFSVVLYNRRGEILLQKRAGHKYHSGGLWTNTCCSHPLPGESMEEGTRRTLFHEMGIDLQPAFSHKFIYRAELGKGLTEYEYDYVFTGEFDGEPTVNPEEVEDWKFMNPDELRADLQEHPENYSSWFKLIIESERSNPPKADAAGNR